MAEALLGKNDYSLVPQHILHEYAGLDADATKRVYLSLKKLFKKESELYSYYKGYAKVLLRNLMYSSIVGMHVDRSKLENITEDFTEYIHNLEKRILERVGRDFNIQSGKQLGTILYKEMKFPVVKNTEGGLPSTDKETLQTLWEKTNDTFVRDLIERKQLQDCLTRQVEGIERFMDADDTIHPAYKLYGTVSGRVSAERPPSTTVPRDRDYTFLGEPISVNIRDFYTAPKGYDFGFADIRQAELVVIAIVSGDEEMLRLINSRTDIHEGTARSVLEKMGVLKPGEKVSPEQRRTAKTVNFAIIYGGSAEGTAAKTGTSVEAITEFMQGHRRTFKGIWRYKESLPAIAAEIGYVESPFGRRRRVLPYTSRGDTEISGRSERQIVNYIPQNCAAEVTYRSLNRICARFKKENIDGWPINTVYDSIEFIWKKEQRNKAKRIVLEEMLRPVPELDNFSFSISFGVSRSWGEAEKAAEDIFELEH